MNKQTANEVIEILRYCVRKMDLPDDTLDGLLELIDYVKANYQ